MAFSPVAFIAPNYRDFNNYWLKVYEPGTTTPKVMALESDGGTQVAKLEVNADGFLVSAGAALVIPYIDDSYDAWLFPTEAEADANDTTNAERLADDMTGVNGLLGANALISSTLAIEKTNVNIAVGTSFVFSDRGDMNFDTIAGTSLATGYKIIAHDTLDLSFVARTTSGVRYAEQFGAFDGIADSFSPIDACIRDLPEGGVVYLPGGDLNLGSGNTLRDDVLDPVSIGKTITLVGVGSSEDQLNSGKVTTLNTTAGSAAIIFDGNRSGGRDFAVKGDGGSLAISVANIIVESSRAQWKNIVTANSRGSGFWFRFGNNSSFENITCLSNKYRGFDADGTGYINKAGVPKPNDLNASVFTNIDVRANGDVGLRTGANSGFSNFYYNITAQSNASVGLQFNGDFNRVFGFYGEANGGDLTSASQIVAGFIYEIVTVGTTDFTLIGSPDNNIETRFIATGPGAGTGTAIKEVDIEFTSTADSNFLWGVFSNNELAGADFSVDLSANQRNYIDRLKSTSNDFQTQQILLGENTSPNGHILFSGTGDGTNPAITLEGTSGSQTLDIVSSGAGTLRLNPEDGITLEASTLVQVGAGANDFQNGWTNHGGSRKVAGFYKDPFGIVHLEGGISNGSVTVPNIIFNLPVGYRPSARIRFSTTADDAFGELFIDFDGNVYYQAGANLEFSLDGVSFRTI